MLKIDPLILRFLENQNYSESEIASYYGISRQTLHKHRKINNLYRLRRSNVNKYSTSIQQKRQKNRKKQQIHRDKLINAGISSNRGRNNRAQQRIAMLILGRKLQENEVIHHIDNNPANNEHSNLVICTQDYHRSVFHTRQAEIKMGINRDMH